MPIKQFIYRNRLIGKRVVAMLSSVLPTAIGRRLRAVVERIAFTVMPQYQGDTLPGIFNYWSGRHLSPDALRLGISSPETFYLEHIRQSAARCSTPVRVASIGSGAASMEMDMVAELKSSGSPVVFTCIDFNPSLMRHASKIASARGLEGSMEFVIRDCDLPFLLEPQDIIIVNQFFHHVTALEIFCTSLRQSLTDDGVLLTSDIIGRNGHRLWPDIEVNVQRIWEELPTKQRYDRYYSTVQRRYRSVDHAAYSNEGVRAQDVVACLLEEFDFELFFTFGGAVMPFVERRIGFNFNPDSPDDRAFIDRVHLEDSAALVAMEYPASNMIASLRKKGSAGKMLFEPISPQQHVDLSRQQLAKTLG